MKHSLTITFDLYDAGCLPGVLEKAIADTERHKRICGADYSPEDAHMIDEFIGQMKRCLTTVNGARERALTRSY